MRKLALVLVALSLAGSALAATFTPDLVNKLATTSDQEMIRVLITMNEQADVNWMTAMTAGMPKLDKRQFVVNHLNQIAELTQTNVRDYLESYEPSGQVKNLQSASIVNILYCDATPEVIRGLTRFAEIGEVTWDYERYMLCDVPRDENAPVVDATDEITWGVSDIHAPEVWTLGYQGTGIIVSVIDTGCNYNHLDLADHMWNGGTAYPHHGWDFYNNDNDPIDQGTLGHGTHTCGTVASDGTAGTQAGVAPNCTLMAVETLSGNGYGSEGQTISGIDFSVQHGADIFSMSLGWQTTSMRANFRTSCNNALAAGVIGAIAAGNEGNQQGSYPIPGNCRTPGDVPPPWLSPYQTLTGGLSCVVTCGATQSNHTNAYFTSVGPSTWNGVSPWNDYAYNPGMGLIDPDVAAPGVDVKSCMWNNNSGYQLMSGTSMATPHVAGAMALMLSKNPSITPAQIDQILEQTALDLGSAGKDNLYGAGLINVLSAVNAVSSPTLSMDVNTSAVSPPITIPANGGSFQYNISVHNLGTSPATFQLWNKVRNSANVYTNVFGPISRTLPAGGNPARVLLQTIASTISSGTLYFITYVGNYPGTIADSSFFTITKSAVADGGPIVQYNTGSGWDVEQSAVTTAIPEAYALGNAYPNPFNPTTTIPFALAQAGHVSLKVYNLNGQEVASVLEGNLDAGQHQVTFDASKLSSGVYLYQLNADGFSQSKKFTLMK